MIKRMLLGLASTILALGMAASQTAGGSVGYYSKQFKVGFRYPAHWRSQRGESSMIEEADFKAMARVSVPEKSYPGTNFSEANATIAVGALSQAACKVFPPTVVSIQPRRRKVGSITFRTVTSTEGAAGNFYETRSYRTFHNRMCYQASLLLHTTNIGNYDPGTVKAVNEKIVFNRLDTILRTFYFGE